MNESYSKIKQIEKEIINKKKQYNTTKATSKLPLSPTLQKRTQYDLGIWSKTKYNLYQQQESHHELNNQDPTYSENHTSNQL